MNNIILLVEDDENDVFFMQYAIEQVGIIDSLYLAQDGQAARDYLEGAGQYADRRQFPLPSLVLLDIKLPYLSGLDVLKWIRKQHKLQSLIVIVLTSSKLEQDINLAYQNGANSYLIKPPPHKLPEMMMAIKKYWLDLNQPPFPLALSSAGQNYLYPESLPVGA